jgi:hypothetical protein
VDDAVVAAHGKRHAMADEDFVAIINYRNFRNLPNSENETLRRINHGGAAGTGDESLEAGNKSSVFSQRH